MQLKNVEELNRAPHATCKGHTDCKYGAKTPKSPNKLSWAAGWPGFVWRDVLQRVVRRWEAMAWFCLVRWWDCIQYNGLVLAWEMEGMQSVVGPELRQSCQSAWATKKWSCWRSMSKSKFELMDQLIRAQTRFWVEGTREPDQTTASKVRAFVTRRQLPPNILPMSPRHSKGV